MGASPAREKQYPTKEHTMARANTGNWSQHIGNDSPEADWWRRERPQAAAGERKSSGARKAEPPARKSVARRGAEALLTLFRKTPGGEVSHKHRSPVDTKDEPPLLDQPPSTGRTTRLGRKVEKPGEGSVAGPSGQKDRVHHDKKHANK
jgi:hypothetical protein